MFCPIAALALLGWPAFVRRHGRPAVLTASGFVLFFLLMACYAGWSGGVCYGPRHLIPVAPLLLAGLAALPETRLYRHAAVRGWRGGWPAPASWSTDLGCSVTPNSGTATPTRKSWCCCCVWPAPGP